MESFENDKHITMEACENNNHYKLILSKVSLKYQNQYQIHSVMVILLTTFHSVMVIVLMSSFFHGVMIIVLTSFHNIMVIVPT
jgi:ABC-type multidrug transport system permease subunit